MLRRLKWYLPRLKSKKSFSLGCLILYMAISRQGENSLTSNIDSAVKKSEIRYNQNLRTTFTEWLKIMKGLDVTKFKSRRLVDSGSRKVRLLDLCLADTIQIPNQDGGSDDFLFGDVTGDFSVHSEPAIFEPGTVCHDQLGIESLATELISGLGSGQTEVIFTDNNVIHANMYRGVINGLVRKLRCKYGHCDLVTEPNADGIWDASQEDDDEIEATYLDQLLVYTNGIPETGLYGWWFPIGGGAIYCTPNEKSQADGDGCVYLYKDIHTGMVGTWKDGKMVTGKPAILESLVMDSGMLKPEMKILEEKEPYMYYQSSNESISLTPMQTDVFEDVHVYIAPSTISKAGEGLFAGTKFEPGDLIAIYNGIRFSEMEHRLNKESRRSPYTIHGWEDQVLDIPKKYQSREHYVASLAHKANHSKKPNGEFSLCYHPRFGEVVCIFATKSIQENQEIFVDYGYIDKYLKTQSAIEGMLKFAKQFGGFEDNEMFKQEMKRTLGFIREKVHDMKPVLSAFKMARSFIKN